MIEGVTIKAGQTSLNIALPFHVFTRDCVRKREEGDNKAEIPSLDILKV